MSEAEPKPHAPEQDRRSVRRLPWIILAVAIGATITCGLFTFLTIRWAWPTSNVVVFDTETLSVVGKLSSRGEYVNRLIGFDEDTGRVAFIEWGDTTSTLKIVGLEPFQVSEYQLNAGRLTNIEGQMRYDFARERFIYVSSHQLTAPGLKGDKITTLALNGDRQEYFVPLRQGYGITDNIMPTPEGLFLVSANQYEARVWLLHSGGKTFGVLSD